VSHQVAKEVELLLAVCLEMLLVQPRLCAATVQSLEDAEPTNTIQQL
jgi:hypothetical protein